MLNSEENCPLSTIEIAALLTNLVPFLRPSKGLSEVRKRPLNKKELSRKEEDIVTVYDNVFLVVHEPKLKVDLTAYVEKHEFCFDAVLDEYVTNDEFKVGIQCESFFDADFT